MLFRLAFFVLLIFPFAFASAQELCDNALDDDQDGLVDLLDPDCLCERALPLSPIPNPSFEDQSCCPYEPAGFSCLNGWDQPSEPTVDYNHSCHWLEWNEFPIPLPLPDGEACVGFRDGYTDLRNENPGWKEYASTCLDFPLLADVTYTIELSVGFSNEESSPPIRIGVYGTSDCTDMTFGEGDVRFGCPTNDPNWRFLGGQNVSGINEWQRIQIELRPREEINVIAIGPDCELHVGPINTYYFIDKLELLEQSNFNPNISLTAHPCDPNMVMQVEERTGFSYQWYKGGIALPGETGHRLSMDYGDGAYQVRMLDPLGECQLTEEYVRQTPESYLELDTVICEGEVYMMGNKKLTTSGWYLDTLKTDVGCDSIVMLELEVKSDLGDSIYRKIFPSESFQVGSSSFQSPGDYTIPFQSVNGCDSTIFLRLSYYEIFAPTAFSPNGDGVNDYFSLVGGEDVLTINRLKIFNRWGKLMHDQQGLSPANLSDGWNGTTNGAPASEGIYIFVASVLFDDGKERTSSGSFTLVR